MSIRLPIMDAIHSISAGLVGTVDLSNEGLCVGDQGAIALASAIENNKSLRELILTNCMISDVGANALLQALNSNETLIELNLNGNLIASEQICSQIFDQLVENRKRPTTMQSRLIEILDGKTAPIRTLPLPSAQQPVERECVIC